MRKVDYIIVGGGYAGLFFAHQLIQHQKSFVLFCESGANASQISAGVCNPLILRYYTKIWQTESLMRNLVQVFGEIKGYLGKEFLSTHGVVRIFNNEQERKEWIHKSQRDDLKEYINPAMIHLKNLVNPLGAAHVDGTTRLHVGAFFKEFFSYLRQRQILREERFDYEQLKCSTNRYQDLKFGNLIFAEGVAVKNNPYFSELPIIPNKGHRLTVELADDLDDYVIKAKHFLFHLEGRDYFYGATYDRDSHNLKVEPQKLEELLKSLQLVYRGKITVKEVLTAFRATTFDRRPMIGQHRHCPSLYILNGLGARGVLNGAFFAKELFDHIEAGKVILSEADVQNVYNGHRRTAENND